MQNQNMIDLLINKISKTGASFILSANCSTHLMNFTEILVKQFFCKENTACNV